MLTREKNDLGYISLDENLLVQIINSAIEPYGGKVRLDKHMELTQEVIQLLSGSEASQDFIYEINDGKIRMTLFLVISFGQSISRVCTDIIKYIAQLVETSLQIEVEEIETVVTAVVSKKAAPRNIVYRLSELKESNN